jgi:hypothetical protein
VVVSELLSYGASINACNHRGLVSNTNAGASINACNHRGLVSNTKAGASINACNQRPGK